MSSTFQTPMVGTESGAALVLLLLPHTPPRHHQFGRFMTDTRSIHGADDLSFRFHRLRSRRRLALGPDASSRSRIRPYSQLTDFAKAVEMTHKAKTTSLPSATSRPGSFCDFFEVEWANRQCIRFTAVARLLPPDEPIRAGCWPRWDLCRLSRFQTCGRASRNAFRL
ncbi:hypothetical protein BKA81DRAFT_357774, partial [Phyllosticta paracitricarpa]